MFLGAAFWTSTFPHYIPAPGEDNFSFGLKLAAFEYSPILSIPSLPSLPSDNTRKGKFANCKMFMLFSKTYINALPYLLQARPKRLYTDRTTHLAFLLNFLSLPIRCHAQSSYILDKEHNMIGTCFPDLIDMSMSWER